MKSKESFLSHIKELAIKSYEENRYMFTYFLDLEEQDLFEQNMPALTFVAKKLWGGYAFAERKIAIFGSKEQFGYEVSPPIVLLRIKPSNLKFAEKLSHRDFLGALLNLGIERRILGDILVEENIAYVYVHESMAEFIRQQLFKVKHTYVTVEVEKEQREREPSFLNVSGFVSSFRLDALLSLAFRMSRKESSDYIKMKKVYKNSKLCVSPAALLKEGDIISVRGYGKFIFFEVGNTSKKGRYHVLLKKYN